MTHLAVRVAKKNTEATGIASFELVSQDGQTLPEFAAGAHIDVHLETASGERLIRQYSLCNDPRETQYYRIAVLRDANSRGGSAAMHERVRVGDTLTISAPRNHFPLQIGAPASLLLAGGIGITPLLCMAQQLQQEQAPFALHYCARSLAHMAFRDVLGTAAFAAGVHLHVDDAGQTFDIAATLASCAPDTALYVCGPGGFIDAVITAARAAGWDEQRIHREYFGAAVAAHAADDDSFEVEAASSGQRYRIPAGKSIIEVLAEHGVDLPVSCEQGVCGTCITRVLAGTPEHRDLYFNDAEHAANDQMTPCCSRSRSALLVLDI
jgi:vanillate O-demethylase ferredoxin subunit